MQGSEVIKMAVSFKDKVCVEICEALGLKMVTDLKLIMSLNSVVKIEATFYPDKDSIEKLVPILKRYKLEKIE